MKFKIRNQIDLLPITVEDISKFEQKFNAKLRGCQDDETLRRWMEFIVKNKNVFDLILGECEYFTEIIFERFNSDVHV